MTSPIDPQILSEAAERLQRVQERITKACQKAGRDPSEITLVGACKRQPTEKIAASLLAGLSELGENYVQPAQATEVQLQQVLKEAQPEAPTPAYRWRMIGHLQRNKAGTAVETFEVIDSVDSLRLMKALNRKAETSQKRLEIGIQVNLSQEESKSGVEPGNLSDLVASSSELSNIRLVSLMTMPAPGTEAARHDFAQLRELRDMLRNEKGGESLRDLNMGMSGDLEVAIEAGATVVRIGTDLGQNFPRARAFPSLRQFRHHGNAGDIFQPETVRRTVALDQARLTGDGDFREVEPLHRLDEFGPRYAW